jgi:hypothetical protein
MLSRTPKYRRHRSIRLSESRLTRFIASGSSFRDEECAFGPAHKLMGLMGHDERARTAFDFRPPASIPLCQGNPWFAIIQGYRMDRIALWRASR